MLRNKFLFQKVKDLNLAIGQYALFGSAPLGIRNLREYSDVDIIATPELFQSCKENDRWHYSVKDNGSELLAKDDIELFYKWEVEGYPENEIIKEAEIIDGLPVVRLEVVLKWKKTKKREEDLEDVKIIEDYLKKS